MSHDDDCVVGAKSRQNPLSTLLNKVAFLQRKIPNLVNNRQDVHPENEAPFENLPEIGRGVAAQFAQQPTWIDTGFLGEPYMVFVEMI